MKVDLNQKVEALDGKNILIDGEVATVGQLASNSLMNSSSEKYQKKGELAKKILAANGEVSLKAEDISLIKECVQEMGYTAQLVYQFEQTIDPTDE